MNSRFTRCNPAVNPLSIDTRAMFLFIFLLAVSSECGAQLYMYGGPMSYRRAPIKRSPMEALERLRAPAARYYPQMDYLEEGANSVYALPPQWTDTAALYNEEQPMNDEDEYDYQASVVRPVYQGPVETYPEPEPELPSDVMSYNDLMNGYYMNAPPPEMPLWMERRSEKTATATTTTTAASTTATSQTGSAPTYQPEKKSVQSMVLPDPARQSSAPSGDEGQKEVPLFRPLHNSQRSTEWTNEQQKSAIPMLKQMIQGLQKQQQQKKSTDPLLEELNSLKKA
ncbi:hypothetical protein JTE90_006892 [Oedothorax gibbosus]|uniref:Uncharacterized protein n=1 Tax=Oedothorax gibbosus TaxID=931172 RepID=A0AAV6VNJ8_9ARAC|nr:hypothetical protein JTE90_006892 [Oedothorax gibbosus]